MAMSATRLRDAIKSALDTRFGALTGSGNTDRLGFASDLAQAIVTEITANATAEIGTGTAGLQRDGDGANPSTLAPTVAKHLSIV